MTPRCFLTAALLAVAATTSPLSLDAQGFDLSVRNIMRGPDLVGRSPGALRGGFGGGGVFSWSPDSRYVYFRWHQAGVDTSETVYRVRPDGGEIERLADADPDTILAGRAVWSPDRSRAVYALDGDLVLWEDGDSRRLTQTAASESRPRWSADGATVYFRSGTNLFALDLETAMLRQLSDVRRGDAPGEAEPEEQRGFLVDQQKRLFEFIESDEYDNQPWNRQTARDTLRPEPFYVGEGKSVNSMIPTPDGAHVLLTISEASGKARRLKLPLWITDDGYLDTYDGRTKVGDAQTETRAAVLEVATGKVTFFGDSVGEGDRNIVGIDVSSTSQHALLRVQTVDNEQRWYVVVDLANGEERIVTHDRDEAWLTFPGPGLQGTAGFMPGGDAIYFGSERSGWAHLYTVSVDGGEPTALTGGEWEVLGADLSPDGESWYLTANREGFAEVHTYTMPVDGGALTQLTFTMGRQDAAVSPDGRWLAIAHSSANHPSELYMQRNRPGDEMRQITESTTEEWRSYDWIRPEIVEVRARDGAMVPARLYRPQGEVAPAGQRPAVVFVHGAGYLQNVHNWWSGYYREYMFHHLLVSRGYTVLDMDYRGSAGHGRDWRTAIYRHMGGQDLTDQVDGAQWLVQTMGVDSTRIGIYGGSYGGFITLMAMFTTPGVFKSGAALRPVTDWAHYNHGYTSSILNEPQNDTLAYVRSSPIYHAEGLEGHLLMAHGMVDDNVLFYDTVRLAQRLIELGKDNWEVAMYPAERHSFQRVSSWADEYSRILKLFETTLK